MDGKCIDLLLDKCGFLGNIANVSVIEKHLVLA